MFFLIIIYFHLSYMVILKLRWLLPRDKGTNYWRESKNLWAIMCKII